MKVTGIFEINLEAQEDEGFSSGRMLISKKYSGELEGSGIGQMLSKRTESGIAVYCAIEEFVGKVKDKKGGFTLLHNGYMSSEKQELVINIVEGSGCDELKGIKGSLMITQNEGIHHYELAYEFD